MTKSYSALFFWLGLTIAASIALYHTSDRVHALDQQLKGLNAQIEAEQESMHVLKAEWVYLANPARVAAAVHRHLPLAPTAPRHVLALSDISTLLPVRSDSEASVAQSKPTDKPVAPAQVAQNIEPTTVPRDDKSDLSNITASRVKSGHIATALNSVHINDHMTMQHAALGQQASVDSIGGLIGSLGLRQ